MITWTKIQGGDFPKDEDILLLTKYGYVTIGRYDNGYFQRLISELIVSRYLMSWLGRR